ncbi:hypothetical protein PCANC_09157 [Puccinia coronata f. sp. avenae]|uniref:Uncharacterized protein n=1 Tax=Puccinia coronata f. sp. avenae TaxID=200324 RepID=A0A2N5VV61_9BASI|nr:hypothetical protein PCANC_09157 [Puccinia coronata f. sp. avenae]
MGALSKSRDWPELAGIEGDQPKPAQASASSIPPSKEATSAFHSGMKPLESFADSNQLHNLIAHISSKNKRSQTTPSTPGPLAYCISQTTENSAIDGINSI